MEEHQIETRTAAQSICASTYTLFPNPEGSDVQEEILGESIALPVYDATPGNALSKSGKTPGVLDLSSVVLPQECQDLRDAQEQEAANFVAYSNCEQNFVPMHQASSDGGYQTLPPISSFREPLTLVPSTETMNPETCSYMPDFSDLYQENACMWQSLYDTREQSAPTLGADLEYLLARAGLSSQTQQQNTMEQYGTQQWTDQPMYEASYQDLQSKTTFAPSVYNTSPQLYPTHLSTAGVQASAPPSLYPVGYTCFANPYPEYVSRPSQSYVPQGYLRNAWDPPVESRKLSDPVPDPTESFRPEESLLKQYLLLPPHKLGQMSGIQASPVSHPRKPDAPSHRKSMLSNTVSRQPPKSKQQHPATITSATSQSSIFDNNSQEDTRATTPLEPPVAGPLSSSTSSAAAPSSSAPGPESVRSSPASSSPTPQFEPQCQQQPQVTVSAVGTTAQAPAVSSPLVRPAFEAASPTQMYIYWSAIARAAAAAVTVPCPSGLQLTPLVLQGPVRARAARRSRGTIKRVAASVRSSSGMRLPTSATVKDLLRKRGLAAQVPVAALPQGHSAKSLEEVSTPRLVQSVRPVGCYPYPTGHLLGDQWKVQVSPVLNLQPNTAQLRSSNRTNRLPVSAESGPMLKKVRLASPVTFPTANLPSPAYTGSLPPFKAGKVKAREHRPRHFEMGRLQIGNFVVLSGQRENGKYTNRLKVLFTRRRFVYEFETSVPPSAGSGGKDAGVLQVGLFCVVVPFTSVKAFRCEAGTEVRLLVDRQPLMFLGSRSKRQGIVEVLSVYDTSRPVDITNNQLKRSPLHLISLKPNQATTLQSYLWNFSDRFVALSQVDIPDVGPEMELPPPEVTGDAPDYRCKIIDETAQKKSCPVEEENGSSTGKVLCSPVRIKLCPVSEETHGHDQDAVVEAVVSSSTSTKDNEENPAEPTNMLVTPESVSSQPESSGNTLTIASDDSSTEIEEIDVTTHYQSYVPSVGGDEEPPKAASVEKGNEECQVFSPCSCRISCRSQRCSCARAQKRCKLSPGDGLSSNHCQCSGCDNPLNILVSLGINEDDAKEDKCLIQNIFRLLHLHSYLHQLVTLECCGERAPLYRFLPGQVPCPNGVCSTTLQYSWCRQLVCDTSKAPPQHCNICGLCRFNDTKHCQACDRCYPLHNEAQQCPTCAMRATLRSRIQTNRT